MEGYPAIILDAVFPPHCIGCDRDGTWFCASCIQAVEFIPGAVCSACGNIESGHVCPALYETNHAVQSLDGLVAVGFYHDPVFRALIHGLKYQSATCLMTGIADVLRRYAMCRRDPWPWAGEKKLSIQAVVASEPRVRARGFDQAVLICDAVRSVILPWADAVSWLQRPSASRFTQAELADHELRQANVHDAFLVHPFDPTVLTASPPQVVLLVDDVFTTGATMRAAAFALKNVGVKRVYGLALALGK